jgi:hypothetical protein
VIGGSGEVGEFGVDGAQAGVGELVLDVPLAALAEIGAEVVEGLFATSDLAVDREGQWDDEVPERFDACFGPLGEEE